MSSLHDFLSHPIETLERALHIRRQIDQLNEALRELFGPSPVSLGGVQINAPKKRGRPRKASAEIEVSGFETGNSLVAGGHKKKRKMSAAAKAKIAAAQKARWAKAKSSHGPLTAVAMSENEPSTAKPVRKKKRTLSPEARAKIVAAVKARWAREKGKA